MIICSLTQAEGCDIEHHLDEVVAHADRRTTTERDWLYPAILKRASETEGPYACFMDYDVEEEPMARYPTPIKKRVYEYSPEPKTPPHDLASPAPKPASSVAARARLGRSRPTDTGRPHFFEPAARKATKKAWKKSAAAQKPAAQKRFAEPAVGGRRSKRRALGIINR